jgi:hypothetical protein
MAVTCRQRDRSLGCERRCCAARCGDNSHLALDKLGHQSRQPIELILSPPILNHNVAAIDETRIAKALTECRHEMDAGLERAIVEKPDYRHRRLLRARRERPRGCRAAERR